MRNFLLAIALLSSIYSMNVKAQESAEFNLKRIFAKTDSISSLPQSKQGPLIGISASNSNGATRISGAYVQAVIKAGGTPVVIPVTADGVVLKNIVAELDGLILSGGGDVNPPYYNEKADMSCALDIDTLRDEYELQLLKFASDRNVPILGICRGHQLINVFFGGTLYQDIPTQYSDKSIKHKQTQPREEPSHQVKLVAGTELSKLFDKTQLDINTIHHQGVKDVAPGFKANAIATDGINEGIEALPNRNILSIQWHPEALIAGGDNSMLAIFDYLIKQAALYHKAKEIHSRILSIDTHTDTPLEFKEGFDIAKREANQINIPKMREGYLDGVYMAAYIRQGKRDATSSQEAVKKVTGLIDGIHRQAKMNTDLCGLAYTADDLAKLKAEGKKAIFIGIENGYGIGKDISNLARYKQMGVGYMTLCHNGDNDICDAASKSDNEWKGLSPFGRDVVKEMNRLGMVIDLSHAGESTFWDVMELSTQPVVATHSSSRALFDHARNLTDKQLIALAKNGGVAQMAPVDIFINKDTKRASLEQFIDHIDHAVKVAGIDHVGIGTDFDGGGGLIGLQGANDLINITVKLLERGYSETDIAKIWGGNYLRVLEQVQRGAKK